MDSLGKKEIISFVELVEPVNKCNNCKKIIKKYI